MTNRNNQDYLISAFAGMSVIPQNPNTIRLVDKLSTPELMQEFSKVADGSGYRDRRDSVSSFLGKTSNKASGQNKRRKLWRGNKRTWKVAVNMGYAKKR